MTAETGTFTPTDEDVEAVYPEFLAASDPVTHARAFLTDTIGPIIERERRAAKVEALEEAADALAGLGHRSAVTRLRGMAAGYRMGLGSAEIERDA